MEITIVYILVYIVEALILFLYCNRLFLPKKDKTAFLITYFLGYLSLFVISNFNIFWLNTLAFCLINAFIILFLYEASPSQSFFHALIITVCMGMSELVIMSAISHFSYNFYQSVSFFQRVCILSVTSKILFFVMMYHFSNFWMRKKSNYHAMNYESIIMTLIPLFSFWIMITLAFICSTTALSVSIDRMISVSSFLLLLVNLLIWDIYQIMQHRNTEYTQMQLQLQKEYDQKQYHETILKQDEEQRILIHDMKQHLQSLAALNQKKEHEKIDSYLSQLITSSSLQSPMRVCDHELMNQIIYRYQRMCQEKRISLRTDIRKNCLHFLTDSELTSLFCNLLDNAVTAADYSADTYIHLSIRRHEESQSCVIAMVNSCRNNPFPSNGRKLYTTKKSKKYHGFGLKSIQKIVDSHNGSMEMYYDDDMQEFHTILMLK